jgi:hypothetical protein
MGFLGCGQNPGRSHYSAFQRPALFVGSLLRLIFPDGNTPASSVLYKPAKNPINTPVVCA